MSDILELIIGGKPYKLNRYRVGELKLRAEAEVMKRRREEFRNALELLKGVKLDDDPSDEDRKISVVLSAMDNVLRNVVVSNHEAAEWLDSPSGQVVCLENSLQLHHSDLTAEQVREMYADLSGDDMKAIDLMNSPPKTEDDEE